MSTANEVLEKFIASSKSKGASDEFLAALLIRRGWPADEVYDLLGRYWETATGLALPRRAGSREAARDAFLYLLSFATLSTWAGALGSLLFEFIDHWIPDPIAAATRSLPLVVTWQLASILVAFPIYLMVMRLVLREVTASPERLESGVRKWLTYIALLVTAGAMIGDLIVFLDRFLAGGLSARFVLKSATVMALCAAIFCYYLRTLRWGSATDFGWERRRGRWFAGAATGGVAATVLAGLTLAGGPVARRQMEVDRVRVQHLHSIAQALNQNYPSALPASVEELPKQLLVDKVADPKTGAKYEYHPIANNTYELCATFDTAGYGYGERTFWSHSPGRTCFRLDASRPPPWP